jgi:hypothetical protein
VRSIGEPGTASWKRLVIAVRRVRSAARSA